MGPGDYLPIPEAAKQNTPEGAKAFVQFFFDNYNHTVQYPTTGAVSRLCLPTSKSCQSLEQSITDLLKDGEKLSAPILQISDVQEFATQGNPGPAFSVRTAEMPVDLISLQGKTKRHIPGNAPFNSVLTLTWQSNEWKLAKSEGLK